MRIDSRVGGAHHARSRSDIYRSLLASSQVDKVLSGGDCKWRRKSREEQFEKTKRPREGALVTSRGRVDPPLVRSK